MNKGKLFEKDIENSFDDFIYVLRLNDSGSSFSGGSGSRFTPESPYDYIIFNQYDKEVLCLELKSTKQSSVSMATKNDYLKYRFYYAQKDKDNAKIYKNKLKTNSIKIHQIINLYEAHKKGCSSYIIINFEKYDKTYAINIIDFINFWISTKKSSINLKDIIDNNGIEITKKNKKRSKIHFKYNVNVLFKNDRKEMVFWQRLLIAKNMFLH